MAILVNDSYERKTKRIKQSLHIVSYQSSTFEGLYTILNENPNT